MLVSINLEFSSTPIFKPDFANYDLNPNQIVYDNLNGYKILDSVLILIGSRHLIKSNCRRKLFWSNN
jgi:hypothetical protein